MHTTRHIEAALPDNALVVNLAHRYFAGIMYYKYRTKALFFLTRIKKAECLHIY